MPKKYTKRRGKRLRIKRRNTNRRNIKAGGGWWPWTKKPDPVPRGLNWAELAAIRDEQHKRNLTEYEQMRDSGDIPGRN